MKKYIAIILTVAVLICVLACGCSGFNGFNKDIFDLTYKFDRAIISLPDGTIIDGKVQSWTDFEDGDQLQIKIDGVTYLVHSSNAVLIAEDK